MRALYLAFLNSWRGLVYAARTERAVRLELALLGLGLPLAFLLGTTAWVRVALVASLLLMLSVELMNTAVEKLCDHLHPDRHARIGVVKDVASASSLAAMALAGLVWTAALLDRL